ncbi:hypothetical protein M413DRAFT_28215 [Hebeloma cylindrosporum]|uniref:RING-type domain-containing protein n=1 Tax=Hebeloma cylindrosporum TaxID=76867 RepID=A0A0C3BX68_HEBCY|nr:hypothetical protein M413DRAFT_28215 [Hebeloma cylindrosporum h7]
MTTTSATKGVVLAPLEQRRPPLPIARRKLCFRGGWVCWQRAIPLPDPNNILKHYSLPRYSLGILEVELPLQQAGRSKKDAVDRDCGICFEYAVVPCRTLCCGKIFCTEHLADWLHGPNAEGRCPNCENACSLEGGTLSLAPPTLLPSSQVPRKRNLSKPPVYPSSPLAAMQPHHNDTLLDSPPPANPAHATSTVADDKPSAASSTSSSATVSSSNGTAFSDEEPVGHPHGIVVPTVHSASSVLNLGDSTTPFSTSWGTVSRFMSIVTFLMFLYKLLS